MSQLQLGELLTAICIAFALGMDSFSVCLGLGMQRMRKKIMAELSIINGLFHMLMPLCGMLLGKKLSGVIGELAFFLGGCLMIVFGLHMIASAWFSKQPAVWISTSFIGMIFFSLGVSIDAFSVGLSFGLFSANTWLMIGLFGLFAALMTGVGLLLGKQLGDKLGTYGEVIGGVILLVFGFKFLV